MIDLMSRTSFASRAVSAALAVVMLVTAPGLQAAAAAAQIARTLPPISAAPTSSFAANAARLAIDPAFSFSTMPGRTLGAVPSLPAAAPAVFAAAIEAAPANAAPAAASVPASSRAPVLDSVSSAVPPALEAKRASRLAWMFDGAAPAPPAGDGPDGRAPSPFGAVAALRAESRSAAPEPFVAATRRVAELERLAKNDPEKARTLAVEYLDGDRETRREVRIAALRVLEAFPLAAVLPFYRKTLALWADSKAQAMKAAGDDRGWYIQRAILLRLGRGAADWKADEDVAAQVKASYKDRNPSVRLAAAAALRGMGVEPGPEVEYPKPAARWARLDFGPDAPEWAPAGTEGAAKKKKNWTFYHIAALWVMVVGLSFTTAHAVTSGSPHPAPPPVQQMQQVDAAPAKPEPPAASAAARQTELLQKIAQSQERVAQAQERSAQAQEAQLAAAKNASGFGVVGMIINAAIFIGLFLLASRLLMGRMGGGAAGGPNIATAVKASTDKPAERFSDIEGLDESLVDVQETLDYLRDPARFTRMGGRAPKGILFEGPPGTGKTLMARALAGETNSSFFAVSGSDFVEIYVGVGARRVRELIEAAAKHKPAIVFIDEIDAVGKTRGRGMPGSDSEREQTINALLTAMDGFNDSDGVLFVAATNRADTLDPALLRPGRFDRKIYVGKPHMGGREAIAAIHAEGKRLAPELDLAYVARRTAGLAGADIESIMNEAALQALRRGADAIAMEDVDEAIDRGTIGAKRSLPMSDQIKERVAYHEAGHVLANLLNENVEARQKVNKFTIIPHGSGALGFAEMGSEEGDKYLHTREELEARIDHALGGLVAEKLVFGKPEKISAEWSTGPGSDLETATNLARAMVQTLGMGEETGLAVTAPNPQDPMGRLPFGERVAERTWREVNKILDASRRRVTERLTRNRHVLEALAQAVLRKETLIGGEIEDIIREAGPVDL